MKFIAVDGVGDPNTSAAYAMALELLYGLSYTIKMTNKTVLDYVVPPLEGFWNLPADYHDNSLSIDKNTFAWTALIRQPEFVDNDIFAAALLALTKKKPELDMSLPRLVSLTEGVCVQIMHIGSYDDEPATIARMIAFVIEAGYAIDISQTRRHHEIYLSDPRRTAAEKLKTIIRYPIRKND